MTNPLIDDDKAPKHLRAQGKFRVKTTRLSSTVRNFHEVTSYLYRGGQPDAEGILELAEAGIKTVLCLRTGDNNIEAERKAVESVGMKFISMPMEYWWFPRVDATAKFLEIVDDEKNWPVFVHCAHGMDRTGLLMAMFRITRLGWHVDDAYHEMKRYGFRRFKLRHFRWTLYQYARTLQNAPTCDTKDESFEKPELKKALFVYNPKAGSAEKVEERLERIKTFFADELGCAVDVHEVSKPRKDLKLETADDVDLIVAIGGDGTVAGVLEAVSKSNKKTPVAVIPTGTSNLLARTLGVYPNRTHRTLLRYASDLYFGNKSSEEIVDHALNTIRDGLPIEFDLARVNDNVMVTSVAFGPIADATAKPKSKHKKMFGMFAYIASMMRQARDSHRKFLIRIDDEEPFEAEAMGIFVSNLPNFGIGTPEDADQARDGLLDLFVVECEGPRDYFRAWLRYIGWLISNHRVPPYLFRRVNRVRATALENTTTPSLAKPRLAVDGDAAGQGPLDVEVIPNAVKLYVPRRIADALKAKTESACYGLDDSINTAA